MNLIGTGIGIFVGEGLAPPAHLHTNETKFDAQTNAKAKRNNASPCEGRGTACGGRVVANAYNKRYVSMKVNVKSEFELKPT